MATKLQNTLLAIAKDFDALGESSAMQGRVGSQMREHVSIAFSVSSETKAMSGLAELVGIKAHAYLEKNPRPEGVKTDTPTYQAWRNGYVQHVHNPVRAMNNGLKALVESGNIKSATRQRVKVSMVGKVQVVALAIAKETDPVDMVCNAINKMAEATTARTQPDCNKVLAALVAVYGIKRINNAIK